MDECCCYVGLAIVEDEKELVNVLLKLFEKYGISVCFIAYDGRDALLNFTRCDPKPHIVLMDYRLPTMNGIEVMKEILKVDPFTKIIFLSADDTIRTEAIDSGATAFLQKPASLKEISDEIKKVLKRFPYIKVFKPL